MKKQQQRSGLMQNSITANCCIYKRCNYQSIWQHFRKNANIDEIRNAAARICRDYLTGRWKIVTPDELIVKRISGGLSNFLYYISLPADDVPTSVECVSASTTNDIAKPVSVAATNVYDKNNKHAIKENKQQKSYYEGVLEKTNGDYSTDLVNLEHGTRKPQKRHRCDSENGDRNLSKRLQVTKKEPSEVLLRIYGQTHGGDALESMITESVVFALLSERNFGPKLHGIFPGGRIEQFIPARPLLPVELADSKISLKIAEKMGEIHSLNIPMSKEPDWIWSCMGRWLKTLNNIVPLESDHTPDNLKKQRDLLKSIDFESEIQWLRSVIDAGDYPVVFCHNDLQEGNILLRQTSEQSAEHSSRRSISSSRSSLDETLTESFDGNGNLNEMATVQLNKNQHSSLLSAELDTTDDSAIDASLSTEPDLFIIDFEYCAYNYRGFDLANHFIEWTIDNNYPEAPYFAFNKEHYPTKQQRCDFITTYLKKYHDDEDYEVTEQELERCDHEIQLFGMLSHLFWSLWAVENVTSIIEFGYCEYGEMRILGYQTCKSAFITEQIKKPC